MYLKDAPVYVELMLLERCGDLRIGTIGMWTGNSFKFNGYTFQIPSPGPLVKLQGKTMQLTIKEDSTNVAFSMGSVELRQLVQLLKSCDGLIRDTIGYLISPSRFVVVAGAPLGVYDVGLNTPVTILKSGTLILEIIL